MNARDCIRVVLAELAPEATDKARSLAERKVLKSLALVLVGDGYTTRMASTSLGLGETTLGTWGQRDAVFAGALESQREETRQWLIGKMRESIEGDGRAAGKAMNILANLWFEELRSSKVETTVRGMPEPGRAKAAILGALNKSGA